MLFFVRSHRRFRAGKRTLTLPVIAGIAGLVVQLLCGCAASRPGPVRGSYADIPAEGPAVKVSTSRDDANCTHFLVENKELCEITMTFEMDLVNLKADVALPYTATFPPGQTEALAVIPIESCSKWGYSYTNYYKLGSNCAQHDDAFVYQLPYAAGARFHVTQAYNGNFSHKGSNRYAIDWEMPEGTPVYAARDGIVVRVRDDSSTGGSNIKFDRFNNYVLIRHDDGTLGHYCHLQKGGCVVRPGQQVKAGDLLAHSGNTGFSSGPHLHFCVFRTKNGKERESIPVRFKTADADAITLVSGRSYRAAKLAVPATTAKVVSERIPGQTGPKT